MENITEKIDKYLSEGKNDYEIYHNSYTSAIKEMEKFAEKNGYTMDSDELSNEIGSGPAKPSKGKTNRFSLSIFKNEKIQKKKIHFQIYNRGTGKNEFELNMYFS